MKSSFTSGLISSILPSHKVWLPPLDEPPTMDQLLGGLAEVEGRGLQAADPAVRSKPPALIQRGGEGYSGVTFDTLDAVLNDRGDKRFSEQEAIQIRK